MKQPKEPKYHLCAWCGQAVTKDEPHYIGSQYADRIHSKCLEFLWKLGIAAKNDMKLREDIIAHFAKRGSTL
jgi:hypothetical protein